jgi:hypothetical protein
MKELEFLQICSLDLGRRLKDKTLLTMLDSVGRKHRYRVNVIIKGSASIGADRNYENKANKTAKGTSRVIITNLSGIFHHIDNFQLSFEYRVDREYAPNSNNSGFRKIFFSIPGKDIDEYQQDELQAMADVRKSIAAYLKRKVTTAT